MTTLTMRPYIGEADLQPIVDLMAACDEVDRFEEWQSVDDLRTEMDEPGFDKQRDARLWEDGEGRLIAAAFVYMPEQGEELDAWLWFKVHPTARGGEVEPEIVAWGERRMREAGHERGKPARLRVGARVEEAAKIELIEARGYSITRYFWRMRRPLDEPIPEPRFPEGLTLRHLAGDQEVDEWVACFNESFIDHWNFHPLTPERRRHYMAYPSYNMKRDLVAVTPEGKFGGFCFCSIDTEQNAYNRRKDGWINTLGTRRGFRKIGLGRALLLAGMHLLKAEGMDTAVLGVDAENPNGALQLYESAGFHTAFKTIVYAKDV